MDKKEKKNKFYITLIQDCTDLEKRTWQARLPAGCNPEWIQWALSIVIKNSIAREA